MVPKHGNNLSVMWGYIWEKTFQWDQITNFERYMGQNLELKKIVDVTAWFTGFLSESGIAVINVACV